VNIGIICYASIGGSGVVATELAKALAERGHAVHLISIDPPFRLGEHHPGLTFHQVQTPSYPLFHEPQYVLSVANTVVQVARAFQLDVIHAHYAVPHTTAAHLAQEVLQATGGRVPVVVTTLHGTDITLVGNDPSFSEIVAFSIEQSDGVTAVSASLRDATRVELGIRREIEIIPNFLDCAIHRRRDVPELRSRLASGASSVIVHISNFRPVKRVDAVMRVFAIVSKRIDARLVLVGEGPELDPALRLAREVGISSRVEALGAQEDVIAILSAADLFLLPSAQESFGLAAAEAMACEVPVVASRVGGLPEVIDDGVTGFLHAPDDLEGMAESAIRLLRDPALHRQIAAAARRSITERFCVDRVVPMYEAYYGQVLGAES
jgi:N-acetyl-alpha-D-glucosaminyl L-malate synthase BshA